MNIGSTSMEAGARAATSALRSALDTQASMVSQLLNPQSGQTAEMQSAAAAAMGKGQNLDMLV